MFQKPFHRTRTVNRADFLNFLFLLGQVHVDRSFTNQLHIQRDIICSDRPKAVRCNTEAAIGRQAAKAFTSQFVKPREAFEIIPEPSTFVLALIGLLSLGMLGRRVA